MAETSRRGNLDESLIAEDENEDTQANKYLFFRIGKESYGIGIRHIIEIIELQKISAVPDMPDYVKGVINLRGKVIPIVDLRLRFTMQERDYDDTVEEVMEISEGNIEPPPRFKSASGKDRYISGLGKAGEAVKILLDVEKIMRDEDARLLEAAAAPMSA
jgi:purine-binding chemotaxis protein CheW